MSAGTRASQPSVPSPRQLSLLATWAPGAAVAFGLVAIGSAVSAVRDLLGLIAALTGADATSSSLALVIGTLVSAMTAVVAGLVAHRLGVEVPRVLQGWRDALAERTRTELDRERTGARPSPR
jgi:hypothetical protein